jgi:hypothetical protein
MGFLQKQGYLTTRESFYGDQRYVPLLFDLLDLWEFILF